MQAAALGVNARKPASRKGRAMREIQVECYAGHRADERPVRFVLRGRTFEVQEVEDRWYSPGATFFRVIVEDGNRYVLRHDEAQDTWTWEAFRAVRKSEKPAGPSTE